MSLKKKKSTYLSHLYWSSFLFLFTVSTPINAQDTADIVTDMIYSIDSLLSNWDVKAYTIESNCNNIPNKDVINRLIFSF
ncbi:hypothetical protein EZS27_021444 [termite gut metagenome]|uniref:Uncharacterized protein n=1 Tax=termite gut metagenome TaxID=433724 RepID=A0A5J4R908_9ZZZZ